MRTQLLTSSILALGSGVRASHELAACPPVDWQALILKGRYAVSTSAEVRDGFLPSFSNGFLAGDAGCSNVSDPPTSGGACGRVHVAGVFNNFTYYDDENAGTFPQRASIGNPFAVTVAGATFVAAALDLELGIVRNRSIVSCGVNGSDWVQVETAIWAHRADRNLLVFELRATNLTEYSCDGTGTLRVSIESCSIGVEGTSAAFHVKVDDSPGDVQVWGLEVRDMEMPPAGSTFPPPASTRVGLAFEPVPEQVDVSSSDPAVRYHAVFHSSLEAEPVLPSATPLAESNDARAHLERYLLGESRSDRAAFWAASDAAHASAWAEVWQGGIEVEGNSTLGLAINASLYALVSSMRADWPLGASPGGLSRNAYEGHSFWDGETWMLPGLVALFPPLADALLEYRAARLPAAQDAARLKGACSSAGDEIPCAVWPWESALLGFGVSPWLEADTFEIHVAGDIALAVKLVFRASGNDPAFFRKYSYLWPVVSASAAFFAAKAVIDADTGNFTFKQVIGPDEGASVVDDSAYTNAVAARTFAWAVEAAELAGAVPGANWSSLATRPLLRVEVLPGSGLVGHPEYSGYTGQDVNQADVALLQYPLGLTTQMGSSVARADLMYYEQRSSTANTRGFYTGDSAYSIAWLRLGGNKTAADAQFNVGLHHIDLTPFPNSESCAGVCEGFGVWKETLNGGNTNFLTGAGGWTQNVVFGYAGFEYTDAGTLKVAAPVLPPGGVSAVTIRGVALGQGARQVRFSLHFNVTSASFTAAPTSAGLRKGGLTDTKTAQLVVTDSDGGTHGLPVTLPVAQNFIVSLLLM